MIQKLFSKERLTRLSCIIVTLLSAISPSLAFSSPDQSNAILIKNGTLIDGTGSDAKRGIDVFIVENKIVSIGTNIKTSQDTKIVDATGKYIIPGLIDTHVHLGAPVLFQLSPEERTQVVEHTPRAFLYNGVTTVLDVGSPLSWIIKQRHDQREGQLLAPRIFALGTPFVPEHGWASRHSGGLRNAEAARKQALEHIAAGVDGLKIAIESGLGSEKTHVELTEDMLDAALDVARKEHTKVYVHAVGLHEYRRAVPVNPVAILHGLSEKNIDGDNLITEIASRNILVVPTASLFRSFLTHDPEAGINLNSKIIENSVPHFMLQKMRDPKFIEEEKRQFKKVALFDAYAWAEKANPIFCENIEKMHKAGVQITVGTDAGGTVGYNFQGYNTPWEVKILTECGLTPMEAITAATRNGAKLIGREATVGTIEPNKIADILILSADPLKDIENIRKIEWIILEGKLYPRDVFAYKE